MRPTRTTLLTFAALAAALGACGSDSKNGGPAAPAYHDDGKLTLVTRNLYLGADLAAIIAATTPIDLVTATSQAWAMVNANDFDARAEKIADEIVAAAPDLVGLQEASLWRTQSPSDAGTASPTPATTVAIDYLDILLRKLAARGHPYVAVKTVELFDFEVPVSTAQGTIDVRLTDRDVLLAVAGLQTTNGRGGAYSDANLLTLSILGQPAKVKRGWEAVDVTIGGQPITVVNTHLEAFAAPPRTAQATELVSILASTSGRIALMGDLNSTPGTEGEAVLAAAGFADAYATAHPGDSGFTCCFPANLHETGALDQRIDYVLTRGSFGAPAAADAKIVGKDAADKTSSGLWPSDHAGLVVTLQPSP
jgi:endonuclease/exonuclease/phosphatase family metal-dependent hydrolase